MPEQSLLCRGCVRDMLAGMPMPSWQDQPAHREYQQALRDLRIALPRWWPTRVHADVVGGDLDTGAVVLHLPFDGNPYLARLPLRGPSGGNTDTTLAELDRTHTCREWTQDDWRYIVFSRTPLTDTDFRCIRMSMNAAPRTSPRAAVFDPTDKALIETQRQRVDWQLLQNGVVHRYDTRFALDTAAGHLAGLGYIIHLVDAATWTNLDDMHTALAAALSFPAYYGRNLDALDDVLRDVAEYHYGSDPDTTGTVLAVAGFDRLLHLDRTTAIAVLDIIAQRAATAALFGHPMLCLIDSTADGLGSVGGAPVLRQTVSEYPPDPPEPFDESTIVEFRFQIFATPIEAEQYAVRMRGLVEPVLAEVGHYQFRPPLLTSVSEGQNDERHSSSGRQRKDGQHLYDIDFAVRGHGDRHVLGDTVFDRVSDADIGFEQMYTSYFSGKYLPDALDRYPLLDLENPEQPR